MRLDAGLRVAAAYDVPSLVGPRADGFDEGVQIVRRMQDIRVFD